MCLYRRGRGVYVREQADLRSLGLAAFLESPSMYCFVFSKLVRCTCAYQSINQIHVTSQ